MQEVDGISKCDQYRKGIENLRKEDTTDYNDSNKNNNNDNINDNKYF